jgi:two-component system sensor histidine kinase/response regulator
MLGLDRRFSVAFDAIDPATAYHGVYEPGLVATSVLIGVLAAFVALSISSRIIAATTWRGRSAWASAGAICMGGGIWAMHFIGMLAFSLPCGITYEPFGTVLSMIPGVLASGVALSVLSQTKQPGLMRMILGATLMGAGIGAMHYAGMAAMRPEALLRYNPVLLGVSVVVAAALAFLSLSIRFRFHRAQSSNILSTLVAATVMGFAIAGMHYTAMQASTFFPLQDATMNGVAMPPTMMALLIAGLTVLVATMTLLATFAGRQNELAVSLTAEVYRREALEYQARDGTARLRAILDAVADAIVTTDRGGRILQWNSGAESILGYRADEVVGTDLTTLIAEPHRSDYHDYLAANLAKTLGIDQALTAIHKDGTQFPIELTMSEARIGDDVFFTGILRDITQRKRIEQDLVQAREQAEAANRAKSDFLATMSHEIRTPMNGVLGMANLLSSTPLNDRQSRLVENLMRSGQALLSIINDILDISKIEAGRIELVEIDFDPHELIADVIDVFLERATKKGLEIIYFVAEDIPRQLRGDPVRLRQILINLVGNAIKFTERGEILVEVATVRDATDDVVLALSVEDTGIGIPSEQRSRVFESFHQVDPSMTRARGGSGLGLAITKKLVEMMGGEISVDSEFGRGSRFRFTARCKSSAAESDMSRVDRQIARPLRALLVDANAVSAHVMSLYLSSWKIDAAVVTTTGEAQAAWEKAAAAGLGFDVAMIDLKGLGASGEELAVQIRSDRRCKPAAIILLVGMDGSSAGEVIEKKIGSFATLTKPVRPSELFDCFVSIGSADRTTPFQLRRILRTRRPSFDARVLVVEDNTVNQEVATGMLERLGCRVVTAPNGRVAVKLLAQDKFDLVLMDCEMPVMDGYQAAKRIRELEGLVRQLESGEQKPSRTAIIACTAHAMAEVRERCLAAGMDDFLIKPFDEHQLIHALRRWIASCERKPAASDATTGRVESAVIDGGTIEPDGDTTGKVDAESVNADAVIDIAAISEIRAMPNKGGVSLFERVVTQFTAIAPALVGDIHTKFGERDAEALWRAAHSLKSSATALGARQLSRRCAEIEKLARDAGAEQVEKLLAPLDAELAAAMESLQQLVGASHAAA